MSLALRTLTTCIDAASHIPDLAPPVTTPGEPLAVRRREAAALLSISERTLDLWTAEGRIPCKRVGRTVLYSPVQLREWLAKTQ